MFGKLLRRALVPALLATAAVLSSATSEAAGKANGLGEKGELIISADRLIPLFSFTHASATTTANNGVELTTSQSGTGLSLLWGRNFGFAADTGTFVVNVHTLPRVGFDYAVIEHLTLGGSVALGFGLGGTTEQQIEAGPVVNTRKTDAPRATAIGFAPRVGYVLPLTDILAFWPRAGFGIYSVTAKTDQTDNNGVVTTDSVTDTLFSLDLDPELAIVPMEHFFFTAGLLVDVPITGSRSTKTTTGSSSRSVSNDVSLFQLGITASLGGWFNL
jgi:hypothetical protein